MNRSTAYILFSNFQSKAQNVLSPVLCVYFSDFADWYLGEREILQNRHGHFSSACSSSYL